MTDTHENLIKESSEPHLVFDDPIDEEENDESEQSLSPSILKEELTIIKGIGPTAAALLIKAGITSIEQLAKFTVGRLSEVKGIGPTSARKMIEGAKAHLATPSLEHFSQPESEIIESQEIPKEEKINSYGQIEEEEPLYNTEKKSVEPWFDKKYAKHPTGQWQEPPSKRVLESMEEPIIEEFVDEITDFDEVYEFEIPDEDDEKVHEIREVGIEDDISEDIVVPHVGEPPVSLTPDLENIHRKVLNHQEIKDLLQKIYNSLKDNGFYVIRKTPELRDIYHGIDFLAIKLIRIKEKLEVICLVPIKANIVNGPLVVSSNKITYNMTDGSASTAVNRKLNSYSTTLSNACSRICENLNNEDTLLNCLKNYLKINLTLEKTRSHKNLYFRSGPVHYKIVVTPMLVSQQKVGFTEKVLPFAYQKDLDLHVVDLMGFSYALQYLGQKYFQIETYNKEQSTITLNNEVSAKLMNLLRKSSTIFMGLGIAGILFLGFALFQGFSVLGVVTNLGYGLIVLYMVILGCFYLTNNRRKSSIHNSFETPYHKRKLNLDDASLMLIKEELPPKLMEQFAYECLDEKNKSKVITNIEIDNAQDFIRKKSLEKGVNENTLFEKREKKETNLDGRLISKYSSFLED